MEENATQSVDCESVSNNSSLPEDLIIDILARLPPISLIRFRKVCKSWKTLISNPQLIAANHRHTTAAASSNPSFIITVSDSSTCYYMHSNDLKSWVELDLPADVSKIVGCSNGIICLYDGGFHKNLYGGIAYFWNPITKWCRVARPIVDKMACNDINAWSAGFGFDSFSAEYKLVIITYEEDRSDDDDDDDDEKYTLTKVYVYSANADSSRQIIVKKKVFDGQLEFAPFSFLNGVLYWRTRETDEPVSFHLHNEVFVTIPVPNEDVCVVNMVMYKDHVALVTLDDVLISFVRLDNTRRNIYSISLWTTDDDLGSGGEVSWTKTLSFDPFLEIGRVCASLSTGEFVVKKVHNNAQVEGGQIFLYDTEKKVSNHLQLPPRKTGTVFHFIGSLLSIQGRPNPDGLLLFDGIISKDFQKLMDFYFSME